jgi:hypothetical protein
MGTGFIWLRIWSSGGVCIYNTEYLRIVKHGKFFGNMCKLLTSEENLCSKNVFTKNSISDSM